MSVVYFSPEISSASSGNDRLIQEPCARALFDLGVSTASGRHVSAVELQGLPRHP